MTTLELPEDYLRRLEEEGVVPKRWLHSGIVRPDALPRNLKRIRKVKKLIQEEGSK